jgi:HPt (histidine-containing phosphotransfer) domain-containing protein
MAEVAGSPDWDDALLDAAELELLATLATPDEPNPVVELVDLFLETTPPKLDELRRAAAHGDTSALRRAAHHIKGGAGSMGARALAAALDELEMSGARGDLSDAESQVAHLDVLYARTREALLHVRQNAST